MRLRLLGKTRWLALFSLSKSLRSAERRVRLRPYAALLVAIVSPIAAHGHELNTLLSFSSEYSNNISQAPSGQGELTSIGDLGFDYLIDYSSLDMTLNYTLSRERFERESFEDTNRLLGSGQGVWDYASATTVTRWNC